MSEMGCGPANLSSLCDVLNMSTISDESYYDHLNDIADASLDLRSTHFKEVALRYREWYKQHHLDEEVTPKTVFDATVNFDGTWAKHGYSPLIGIVLVILVATGEVVDAEVLCKTCTECHKWEGKDRDSAEYKKWSASHKNCDANFAGSSPAMDAEGAARVRFC